MDAGTSAFILLVIAMVMITAIVTTWIQARAKKPSEAPEAARQIEMLSNENAGLKGHIGRLEERLSVLERIATDPSERTARAIEELR